MPPKSFVSKGDFTVHMIFVILAVALITAGCSTPSTFQVPVVPQESTAAMSDKGKAEVVVKVENGPSVRVHNDGSVKVRVDFAKSIDGSTYSNQPDIYATFPVTVKQVTLEIYRVVPGALVSTYTYGHYQSDQKSFALSVNSGVSLEFNTEYSYLVSGTDPLSGDKYVANGEFKTGRRPFPASEDRDPITFGRYATNIGGLGMTGDGFWYKELVNKPTMEDRAEIQRMMGDGMATCQDLMCTESYEFHWVKGQFVDGIPSWLVKRLSALSWEQGWKAMEVYSGSWVGPIVIINNNVK